MWYVNISRIGVHKYRKMVHFQVTVCDSMFLYFQFYWVVLFTVREHILLPDLQFDPALYGRLCHRTTVSSVSGATWL